MCVLHLVALAFPADEVSFRPSRLFPFIFTTLIVCVWMKRLESVCNDSFLPSFLSSPRSLPFRPCQPSDGRHGPFDILKSDIANAGTLDLNGSVGQAVAGFVFRVLPYIRLCTGSLTLALFPGLIVQCIASQLYYFPTSCYLE